MKLNQLRKLIREEISEVMNESNPVEDLVKKSFTYLVENQPDFITNILSKITGGTMDDKMVGDYWDIMVKNQPDDVIDMLVKLTSGELTYENFSSSTEDDIYDSFRDDEEFNEDDEDEDDDF